MDTSRSWVEGEHGAPAVVLRGVPIPLAATFHQLGVDVAIGDCRITGPVLSRRLEAGRSALRRLPHLSTYDRREQAISTLVTPLALHGMAVASVTEPDLRGLETAVVPAPVGSHAPVPSQEGHLYRPLHGASCLPSHAHAVQAHPLAGLRGPAAKGHPGLHRGYLGMRGPPTRDVPPGARAPHGGQPGLDPA